MVNKAHAGKVPVIVTVVSGVAEVYASDSQVEAFVVDLDNIGAGDEPVRLPDTPIFRCLAGLAGLTEGESIVFGEEKVVDARSALADCVLQMEQTSRGFTKDKEFQRVLRQAQKALKATG